jgi:hypothetical protein
VSKQVVSIDRSSEHLGEHVRDRLAAERIEPTVLQIAQARRKAEAKKGRQSEHLVGRAASVSVMLSDACRCPVLQQSIRNIPCFGRRSRNDRGAKGPNWSDK